jgi:hypothetical protein
MDKTDPSTTPFEIRSPVTYEISRQFATEYPTRRRLWGHHAGEHERLGGRAIIAELAALSPVELSITPAWKFGSIGASR